MNQLSLFEDDGAPQTLRPRGWTFSPFRVAQWLDHPVDAIKEVLVTSYPEGAGIGWHKDAEVFGNAIVGVSLLSDCTMKFRHPETKVVYKLEIPRRSAYIFADEARWIWHHSIASHRERRVSITFRTLAEKRGRLDIPLGQI
jgi:alkylated DNA repair dioxygenase AlkB